MYLRTVFSVFDAYTFYLSARALAGAPRADVVFSAAELERLREGEAVKHPDGSTTWKRRLIPTGKRLRTAIEAFAKVRKCNSPLTDGKLPDEFGVAAEVRNRITHPRRSADFLISPEEATAIAGAMKWFQQIAMWARDEELSAIEEIKKQVKESFATQIEALQRSGAEREPPE